MDIAAIGVGGAGGRIVDRLAQKLGTGAGSPLRTVHAIDTDSSTLDALGAVPAADCHLVGQFETGGDGTDGDRVQATEIVENERTEIRRAVEDGIPTTIDAIVIAAGLAGGTASAVTPALTTGLANVYEQPIYTVSVLPSERETDDQRRTNTAQALTGLEDSATAQVVFDNDAWLGDETLESYGDRLNAALTERLGELFTLGQQSSGTVGEQVIDTRDVMGTLDGGKLVSLGYASRPIAAWRGANSSLFDGLKRRVLGDDTDDYERGRALKRTLGWATRGTLTFECPRTAATHGLVAFRGPPEWLRGDAISRGREWLADRAAIERLRSGDIPVDGAGSLDVFVVLAGIEEAPRINAFRQESTETDSADDTDENEDATADAEHPEEEPEDPQNTEEEPADSEEWGVPPGESGENEPEESETNDETAQNSEEEDSTEEEY